MTYLRQTLVVGLLILFCIGCGSKLSEVKEHVVLKNTKTIAAAGDIACPPQDVEFRNGEGQENECRQKRTADLVIAAKPDAVLPLGDLQYDHARTKEFAASYNPSWGRFLNITRPAIGNHEYGRDHSASAYFKYFGKSAGDSGKGYYSFELGSWHLIALNSNCKYVGGCERGSPQEVWLRKDLTHNRSRCTLAYWHHPLFSSSAHGNDDNVRDLWRALYAHHADVVLNGHDHVYERFDKQTPDGKASERGIREFVVGSGGKEHYTIMKTQKNSRVHDDHTFGILTMKLAETGYSWKFTPIRGSTFTDSGLANCV